MIRKMGSFRSYVGLEDYEMKPLSKEENQNLQPDFLEGELVISEALNVLRFSSLSKKKGLSGSLFVTNARVIFVSSDNRKIEESVPLLSINQLWYYVHAKGSAGSKKHRHLIRLGPSSFNNPNPNIILSGSTRVHEILISCSTFKMLRFSFKFSPLDHGLRISNAIIHHSFPVQLDRLFYFDYAKVKVETWRPLSMNSLHIPTYFDKGDWLKELNITRCGSGYRISTANEGFQICGSLPEWIVVPADLIDVKLWSLAEKLKGSRPPHWSWADAKGGGILRMSKLNSENDSSAENAFFEVLRKTHPRKRPPHIIDLDKELPVKDIRQSFNKLFEMCCPETFKQYEDVDSRFYSTLEQTRWMNLVSKTLEIVTSASNLISSDNSLIILQEQESRDTACVCSPLLQIIVDPRFRTLTGFFSLIQKEWIAFGHPFHATYMHASPVFLLFLDSVHQLMKQNPVDFEFNDKLLANIWEASFDSTRATFLFDCPVDRKRMDPWKDSAAWEMVIRIDDEENLDVESYAKPNSLGLPRSITNPFFKLKHTLQSPKVNISTPLRVPFLHSSSRMCDLIFWENLYLRTFNTINPLSALVGTDISKPKLFKVGSKDKLKVSSDSLVPYTPLSGTPTPDSTTESSFTFPSSAAPSPTKPQYYSHGRDPTKELQLVEQLLSTASTSTRYIRHSTATAATSSRSNLRDKGNTSSNNLVPTHQMDIRRRRNPFNNT